MRKIHIDGEIFEYKIGDSHVRIKLPNGKSITPNFSEITGWDWNSIERGQWKRYFSIKPNVIKEYLINNL